MIRLAPVLCLCALTLVPSESRAGAANAELSCESISKARGSITLKGEIPGDFAEFSLVTAQADKSMRVTDQNGGQDQIHVVESWKDRVFTLTVVAQNPLGQLQLYALPNSVVRAKIPNGSKVRFTAIALQLPIPGYAGAPNTMRRFTT